VTKINMVLVANDRVLSLMADDAFKFSCDAEDELLAADLALSHVLEAVVDRLEATLPELHGVCFDLAITGLQTAIRSTPLPQTG
jgi:hypothetical protein